MSDTERHAIQGEGLAAVVSAQGAELHSISTPAGGELLWQAGPEWPRHAPVLFPIVGRLANDRLLHRGAPTRLTQHGFARDRAFTFIERDVTGCRLVLEDDAQSRAIYPFAFRLEIAYGISGATLTVSYNLANPGLDVLPASLGAHPAFAWPLQPGLAASAHEILFDSEEPAPIRRLQDGLLRPDVAPTPVQGRRLQLTPALFEQDAVILEEPASRGLRYGIPDGPALRIGWTGFSQLGIWSKIVGDGTAPFLCIEPWNGLASPQDFDGEFLDKPHLMLIPPGSSVSAAWTLTPEHIA
ncbi:aldose 1-epimerase family protein [Lichenicoccus sp.]|uniref:aldose 1-epimerase family protein n=1 Tax=Lichenicoccus sp. TaxID=2781899 RepID=UPI003D0A7452